MIKRALPLLLIGPLLGGCPATVGSGTASVTCQTIKFVYLSRKDTPGTIQQVAENNASWISTCGNPPPKPKGKV